MGAVVGRIVVASPIEGERYYLGILLNHVKGPLSFEHLKLVNGVSVKTFREAVLLQGLPRRDNNSELCLQEACAYQMPKSLRRLFATILAFSSPDDPKKLWDEFKEYMCQDYLRKSMIVYDAELKTLQSINSFFEPFDKSLNDYGLAIYDITIKEDEILQKLVNEELVILISEVDLSSVDSLNREQRIAYNAILSTFFDGICNMYFVDDPGGTGKSFLYRVLLSAVRSRNLVSLATASSGVAAGLLPGGRTAHSMFKIPLCIDSNSVCSVSKQSTLTDLFRMTQLIIWDEAPMINSQAIEALDKMLRDINDVELPFGGKLIILG